METCFATAKPLTPLKAPRSVAAQAPESTIEATFRRMFVFEESKTFDTCPAMKCQTLNEKESSQKIVPVVLSQTQSSRPSVLGTEPKSEINALWLLLLSDAGNPAGAPSAHGARGQERSAKVYPTAKVYPREVWSLGLQCQETCLSYSAVLVASPRIHQQQHQHRTAAAGREVEEEEGQHR